MQSIIHIAITGACCTGKTELAKALSNVLHFPIIDEGARPILRQYRRDSGQHNLPPKLYYQAQGHILNKRLGVEFQKQNQSWIADRTVIDIYNFLVLRCADLFGPIDHQTVELSLMTHWLLYSCIFYLPFNNIPYEQDEDRKETFGESMIEDLTLRGLYAKLKIPYHELQFTSIDSRVNEIIQFFEDKSYAIAP